MPFPLDITCVKSTEAKLGVSFPLGFVARMLRDNGGEIQIEGEVWWLYPFLDRTDRRRLKRTCNDIMRETESAQKWPGFPSTAVAVAGNGSGDQLILLPRPEAPQRLQDAVFLWDHETGEVHKIADDFVELDSELSDE